MQRAASIGSFIWVLQQDGSKQHLNHESTNYLQIENRRNNEKSSVISTPSIAINGIVDYDKDADIVSQTENNPKVYKRRFYILFLFSVVSFMQYNCWNTFGPISTSAMAVFDWTESEIAIMASLDPFTYLIFMLFFSWAMDVKGLRISMLLTVFFMALGTGLRCITSNNDYVTWTIAAGQFLNGLAGPVTQAAPPLLSANWFPAHERTTATAVASLCGSLGVALSFIIGPLAVKDINLEKYRYKNPYENITKIYRYNNKSITGPPFLSDSIFYDASHYWSTGTSDSPSLIGIQYKDFKATENKKAIYFNPLQKEKVVLGNLRCVDNSKKCGQGLSITFLLKFENISSLVLLGTNDSSSLSIMLENHEKDSYLTVKLEHNHRRWSVQFGVKKKYLNHVAVTWNEENGLKGYRNGTLVTGRNIIRYVESKRMTSPKTVVLYANEKMVFVNEIVLWEDQVIDSNSIEFIYFKLAGFKMAPKEEKLQKERDIVILSRKNDVMKLMYAEFAVNAILLILVIIYFPDKPPTPPSVSARKERDDFMDGAKKLLRHPQFWTLSMIYGITTGVYSGWGAVLNVNLSSFGISQNEAGWLGFYAVLAGITAGMVLARCADLISGRMKLLLLLLFFGATGCFLWFCLSCLQIVTYSKESLYASAIAGGFFVSGTIPLFYELTIEQTYPIAEGITTGILTMINNVVTVIFLMVLIVPRIGTIWMNWVLFGACAICIPVLIFFKENYNRLNLDLKNNKNENEDFDEICSEPKSLKKKLPKFIQSYVRNPHEKGNSLWSLSSAEIDELLISKNNNNQLKSPNKSCFKHTPLKIPDSSNSGLVLENESAVDSIVSKRIRKSPVKHLDVIQNEPCSSNSTHNGNKTGGLLHKNEELKVIMDDENNKQAAPESRYIHLPKKIRT